MRLQGAFRHALIVVTTGLFASGCLVDIVFDPVGTDATVAATWSVEGAAPTAESCAELGVTRVRVRFYDGVRRFDHPDLVFDCADGSFDTRPRAVVADGIYDMQLLAIDNAGVVIGEGPRERVDTLAVAGHIQLTAVDFQRAATPTQVAVSWTINGAAPSSASCDALGIARVGIDFMDGGAPSDASCAAGSLTVEVTAGTYSVQVAAFDDQGATIAAAMEQTFTVEEGLTFELNNGTPVDFIGGVLDIFQDNASLHCHGVGIGIDIDDLVESTER